jgi:hypothetical protein
MGAAQEKSSEHVHSDEQLFMERSAAELARMVPPADPRDVASPEALVRALHESVNGPVGAWDEKHLLSLCLPHMISPIWKWIRTGYDVAFKMAAAEQVDLYGSQVLGDPLPGRQRRVPTGQLPRLGRVYLLLPQGLLDQPRHDGRDAGQRLTVPSRVP